MGALMEFILGSISRVFAVCVTLSGLLFFVLGSWLASLGGSPMYLASGAILLASGVQLFRGRLSALHFAAFNFIFTWIWALSEVGLDGWALMPRVDFICDPRRADRDTRRI
jgi:glucose dehydrogenase